ncbi:MAG: HAMP domain-containing sensor histidine kinase [Vulcanimicrobiaceae bacterium]
MPERRLTLSTGAAFVARLRTVGVGAQVPVLAIRLPDLERVAWRRGVRTARLLERRAIAAFGSAVARVLRGADLVAHDRGSDVFVCALVAPMREGGGAPADARAALARITATMHAALRGTIEGGWTSIEPFREVPALDELIERALARGAQERERYGFFSALGHELRTPLASIRGYLETLLDDAADPTEQRRFVHIAYHETLRMSRLIEGMFEISLLDLHGGAVTSAGGSLSAACEAVGDAIAAKAARRGVQVVFGAFPSISVALDTDRLTLVLRNLVDNAIEHGRTGGQVAIGVSLDGREVRVMIDDDGPGVAAAERERIFALGERGATSADGSGIGLALVRLMVERAGGRVAVGRAPLGGARFTVTLARVAPVQATNGGSNGGTESEPDGAFGGRAARGAPALRR